MSDRDTDSKIPRIGTLAAAGLVLIGIAAFILRMPARNVPVSSKQVFFTVDDGKTWFADSSANIPPFDKDGKEAVRAHVYLCADGMKFVSYLERFNPQAKQTLQSANTADPANKAARDETAVRYALSNGREIKRPGSASWIAASDIHQAAQVMAVKCPDGSAQATAVEP